MNIDISHASIEDADSIITIQKSAYASEAILYDDWQLMPLTETVKDFHTDFELGLILKAMHDSRIVGSVRAVEKSGICAIGRLSVDPQFQGMGVAKRLLAAVEAAFPDVGRFELYTGRKSLKNIALYQKCGYTITHADPDPEETGSFELRADGSIRRISFVYLEKTKNAA